MLASEGTVDEYVTYSIGVVPTPFFRYIKSLPSSAHHHCIPSVILNVAFLGSMPNNVKKIPFLKWCYFLIPTLRWPNH